MKSERRKLGKALVFAVLFVTLIFVSIGIASAGTIYVPDDYLKIQWAVDNATAGDTIIVKSGTYYESVNVNKQLILRGVDTGIDLPVVDAGRADYAFILHADGSLLEWFTVTNASLCGIHVRAYNATIANNAISKISGYGISLDGGSTNNTITNNTIGDISGYGNALWYGYGISLFYSSNNTLSGNTIANISGSKLSYPCGSGISLWYSSNNTLSGNMITNTSKNGIYLEGYSNNPTSNNTLNGNMIANTNWCGIHLKGFSTDNTLSSNTISTSGNGIYLARSLSLGSPTNNTLSGNTISNISGRGIYIGGSSNNTLSGNTISNISGNGIEIGGSANNTLNGNTITNSYFGFYISHSSNNTIYLNDFINNTHNFSVDSTNVWNSTSPLTYRYNGTTYTSYLGNYWDDYSDVDVNGDGIWDNPYSIDSDQDYYPLKEGFENYVEIFSDQPQLKAPWRGIAKITQGNNGTTSHYDHGAWDNTYAIDVALPVGSDVLAPADGTVIWYDDDPGGAGGKELAIQHTGPTGTKFVTVYLHLSDIIIKSGAVTQGQVVAKSGDTGDVTGAHLHFHLWSGVGSYDSHTIPIERLIMKQVGVDSDFREYDARKGDLEDNKIAGSYFESNNMLLAKPVLTSPLEITPEKDTYYVGDTLTAEFTITNIGDVPITLDQLLVGGRFNDGKLPNGEFPDFTFQSVTLQPNVPHQYAGTLELTQPGIYQFFIAYYIENPTPEEKALLDENNWNTCVDLGEGLTDEDRTEEIRTAPGYAIIVAGQGIGKCGIDHAANNAYRTLRNLGFDDNHIFYLNSNQPQDIDGDGDSEVDALALLSQFENAINQVKAEIGDNPTPLVFYLTGHGLNDPDCFIFDEGNPSEGYLWVAKFQEELDKFSEGTPMLIVIGSCYSGRFITSNEGISSPNRIIITAAHDDQKRYLAGWGWFRASDQFWGDLNKGFDVKEAFVRRTWPADKRYLWLDDNGDSIGHPPHNLRDDGELAAATKIGIPGTENLKLTPWTLVVLRSPGELRVYDSQNRVTGLVNGEVKEEIPNSIYDEESETVAIFSSSDTYRHEIVGTDEGTYGLDIASIEDGDATTFTATEIPTSPNATHEYTVNWTILSHGGAGVTLKIDADGDGEFEETITIQPPIANFTYTPENPVINQTITFDASNSTDLDGNITSYKWDFGDGANGTGEITTHSYSSAGNYTVTLTVRDEDGATAPTSKTITIYPPIFDTGSPANPYPSIAGTHNGTITPSYNISVSKLYTYPCASTGGHTEYVKIWNSTGWDVNATWNGYKVDWHNITFNKSFTLKENETYNYTIQTGSYPQIIHESPFNATGGTITCDKFIDTNGRIYYDGIPAIKFF